MRRVTSITNRPSARWNGSGRSRRERHAAGAIGLRYTCDDRPGIRREAGAKGFRYRGRRGNVIRDASTLERIRALAIPPAWTNVWICPDARGHTQATGRDARGRKQYRYHAHWRVRRDETKFDRIQVFASALPRIRARTAAALARPGLPREKVFAAVVQLLEKSLIRIGNDEYARANRSFGLTTLRDSHVEIRRATLRFEFRGKSGKRHSVDVNNPRLLRVVRQCRDLPGQTLFQYVDANGARRKVNSADVNRYLKEITGEDITAKDFRTWGATVIAAAALREVNPANSRSHAEKNVLRAIDVAARVLGNTRTVCRKSYIHPAILEAYVNGSTIAAVRHRTRRTVHRAAGQLRVDEAAVLDLLEKTA